MKLPAVISCVVGIFAIIGGLYAFDCTYARDDKVFKIEQRLDRKILSDDVRDLQRRQWDLQRHYGEDAAKKKQEWKELENRRQMILRELNR
jgi:hypothetical protein